jgi:acyl carrier protein phosphodiesterase
LNYLAHALLAEPYAHSLIGNIAGDLVKGRLTEQALHPRVIDGIRRHRRVDVLTDSHPRYQALRAGFPPEHRRYAGIVLDVLFDHYLSRHWQRFSYWKQEQFIAGVYAVLNEQQDLLPMELARVAPYWTDADWLRVYADLDGVHAVLKRLSRRLSRRIDLCAILEQALGSDQQLEAGFLEVFHDVQGAVTQGPPDLLGNKHFPATFDTDQRNPRHDTQC